MATGVSWPSNMTIASSASSTTTLQTQRLMALYLSVGMTGSTSSAAAGNISLTDDLTPSSGDRQANMSGEDYSDLFEDVLADFRASLYTFREPRTVVLITIYVPVFLLAFLGNILVIGVIVADRALRSVTNYFLLNLAVADLLVTFVCIPLTVGEMAYKAWIYGLVLCKATGYLQGVSIAASVLTIMGLALDRYLVLRHPVRARRLSTPAHARRVLALIWLIAGCIMVPLVFVRHLAIHPLDPDQTLAFCHERWPGAHARRTYDLFLFIFIYVCPGVVVVGSYASTGCHLLAGSAVLLHRQNSDASQALRIMAGRRRVARMLLALAGLFAGSWLPYHIVSLYVDFQDTTSGDAHSQSLVALSFALLLGHSHSAQNPILYCIMNSSLKRAMLNMIACRKGGHLPPDSQRCDLHTYSNGTHSFRRPLTSSFRQSPRHLSHTDSIQSERRLLPEEGAPNKRTPLLQCQWKTTEGATSSVLPLPERAARVGEETEMMRQGDVIANVIAMEKGEGGERVWLTSVYEEPGGFQTKVNGEVSSSSAGNKLRPEQGSESV